MTPPGFRSYQLPAETVAELRKREPTPEAVQFARLSHGHLTVVLRELAGEYSDVDRAHELLTKLLADRLIFAMLITEGRAILREVLSSKEFET